MCKMKTFIQTILLILPLCLIAERTDAVSLNNLSDSRNLPSSADIGNTFTGPFSLVSPDNWRYQAVQNLFAMSPLSHTRYRENHSTTRYEIASMLHRYIQIVDFKKVDKYTLTALRRLIDAFQPELKALGYEPDNSDENSYIDNTRFFDPDANVPKTHWSFRTLRQITTNLPLSFDLKIDFPSTRFQIASELLKILQKTDMKKSKASDRKKLWLLAVEFRDELILLRADPYKVKEYLTLPFLTKIYDMLPTNHWVYDALEQLNANGVLSFNESELFQFEKRPITRYQTASLIRDTLPRLALHRAASKDIEAIKKLLAEFQELLAVWDIPQLKTLRLLDKWETINSDIRPLKYRDLHVVIKPQFDEAGPFKEGRASVRLGTQWGIINKKGIYIAAPMYDLAGDFSDGVCAVALNDRYGFIDRAGVTVIEPIYDLRAYAKQGKSRYILPKFAEGLCALKENDSYFYIDKKGKKAFQRKFKRAYSFSEGLAFVQNEDGQFAFIDKTGKDVIYGKDFDSRPEEGQQHTFSEGLAAVAIFKDGKRKWGYIDRTGKFAIEPRFDRASPFSDGASSVAIINPFIKGLTAQLRDGTTAPLTELATSDYKISSYYGLTRYAIIDKEGYLQTPHVFLSVEPFVEGIALAYTTPPIPFTRATCINKKGQQIFKLPKNHRLWGFDFSEGLIVVCSEGPYSSKFGYANEKGELIGEALYDEAFPFSEGYAVIQLTEDRPHDKARKFGYIQK